MIVLSRALHRSYRLAEIDRVVSRLKYAAFHLIPYHVRSLSKLEVTQFVNSSAIVEED